MLSWREVLATVTKENPSSSPSRRAIDSSNLLTIESPLANVTSGIEERRCDLIGRHRDLRNKVTTMERSIPALLAYNMWMTEQDCREDTPYRKVREIMNKFSPQPDPADRLVAELRNTVDDLHRETAQLHDKIIDADVKLEEASMELESLELANREMEEKLIGLQNEVKRHSTPSLHSIHSEDLICLKKIRQLAEEELKLKNCIGELEDKEIMYRRQMGKLLSCKKFQQDSKKMKEESMMQSVQKSKGNRREHYSQENHKHNMKRKKYTLKDKERTCCTCVATPITGYEKTSKKFEACDEFCSSLSCCFPLDSHVSRATTSQSYGRKVCYNSCEQISTAVSQSKSSYSTKPLCDSSIVVTSKVDVPRSLKQPTQFPVSCNLGKTCNECETPGACKQIISCKCDCEGTCARESSSAPCDCSMKPLDDSHRLTTSGTLRSGSEADDSNSDEEFCECCSCGGSENSS